MKVLFDKLCITSFDKTVLQSLTDYRLLISLHDNSSKIVCTASGNEEQTLLGAGEIVCSSPSLYLPVFTRYPRIPTAIAPAMSSFMS